MPMGQSQPYHEYHMRVYYQDTDAGGVVYHARYADFAERARCEFLRDLGITVTELQARDNILLVVKKITMDFHNAARLDDGLRIRSDVGHIGGASLSMHQEVYHAETQATPPSKPLVAIEVLLVGVQNTQGVFKTHALPTDLKQALTPYVRVSAELNPKENAL